ncbi:MAG: hypothetical protein D6675_00740 [Gemmatimonadetes bacterium]|nr:MAG: hypothetical protein D6675_00740 [Gemmatimonadota bacterium]
MNCLQCKSRNCDIMHKAYQGLLGAERIYFYYFCHDCHTVFHQSGVEERGKLSDEAVEVLFTAEIVDPLIDHIREHGFDGGLDYFADHFGKKHYRLEYPLVSFIDRHIANL